MPPFGKIEPKFNNEDDAEENLARIGQEATQVEMPAAQASIESSFEKTDEDLIAELTALEASPPKPRIKKKRLFALLLILAMIVAAIVFSEDIFKVASTTIKNKANEVESIAKINSPTQSKFIDDGEQQNKYLKENSEAKEANVSVFDFDINNCLQQYSEEQCTDMYEKNLLIGEKK